MLWQASNVFTSRARIQKENMCSGGVRLTTSEHESSTPHSEIKMHYSCKQEGSWVVLRIMTSSDLPADQKHWKKLCQAVTFAILPAAGLELDLDVTVAWHWWQVQPLHRSLVHRTTLSLFSCNNEPNHDVTIEGMIYQGSEKGWGRRGGIFIVEAWSYSADLVVDIQGNFTYIALWMAYMECKGVVSTTGQHPYGTISHLRLLRPRH